MDASSLDRFAIAHQQATDRLSELHGRLATTNQQLYRHLALYLQVLRQGLLPMVQRACFHLVSETSASTYAGLSEAERTKVQERIRQLVERCSCLLTVEQLVSLAAQLKQQERETLEQRSREFLESLQSQEDASEPNPSPENGEPGPQHHSIHLGLDLPISAELFSLGLPGLAGLSPLNIRANPSESSLKTGDAEHLNSAREPDLQPREPEPPAEARNADLAGSALSGMDAVMALAAGMVERLAEAPEPSASEPISVDESLLPRDPQKLLQWWQQFDQALSHRLRHLSHGLNGVMVRRGLSRAMLPLPLLEAVTSGQLEVLSAPANLVKLPLPMPPASGQEQGDAVMGVLLRQTDLEFEWPPLRTCRQRLEQHRRQMRRMAQHHHYWQRRRQSIQAQMLWEKDINGTTPQPETSD